MSLLNLLVFFGGLILVTRVVIYLFGAGNASPGGPADRTSPSTPDSKKTTYKHILSTIDRSPSTPISEKEVQVWGTTSAERESVLIKRKQQMLMQQREKFLEKQKADMQAGAQVPHAPEPTPAN